MCIVNYNCIETCKTVMACILSVKFRHCSLHILVTFTYVSTFVQLRKFSVSVVCFKTKKNVFSRLNSVC